MHTAGEMLSGFFRLEAKKITDGQTVKVIGADKNLHLHTNLLIARFFIYCLEVVIIYRYESHLFVGISDLQCLLLK